MESNIDCIKVTHIVDGIHIGSFELMLDDTFDEHKFDIIIFCYQKIKEYEEYSEILKKRCVKTYMYCIHDDTAASILDHIDKIADKLSNLVENKKRIYLCCSSGLSVSPALAIYYYMYCKNVDYFDAFDNILDVYPNAAININFISELSQIGDQFRL